jgi:hypothetical protein
MYELIYTYNSDKRNNYSCITWKESFIITNESIVFDSEETLKKICRILKVSRKNLFAIIKQELTKIDIK